MLIATYCDQLGLLYPEYKSTALPLQQATWLRWNSCPRMLVDMKFTIDIVRLCVDIKLCQFDFNLPKSNMGFPLRVIADCPHTSTSVPTKIGAFEFFLLKSEYHLLD
jgi:hypothetical protein